MLISLSCQKKGDSATGQDLFFFANNQKGITLTEQIIVVVIIGIAAMMGFNSMQAGAANKNAKQVLEATKQTAHAVRMYQLNTGSLPSDDLSELEDKGYIVIKEFPHLDKYNYTFVPSGGVPAEWSVRAQAKSGSRTLTVKNKSSDFEIADCPSKLYHSDPSLSC